MNTVIIDVRENDEYLGEHIENSIHIPMGEFAYKIPSLAHNLGNKDIVIMCRSGTRAQMAYDQIKELNLKNISVYPGGILEWKNQGNPTKSTRSFQLPIMRQVQTIAGMLILTSVTLAWFKDIRFMAIAAFVGAGLTIAGTTGFCGMAKLLAFMPWNKTRMVPRN
jgi:rhodanese-related sulfurtransferase